ncbi:hypothetical protein ACTVZO_45260 [Streptomyces sp. IBSNAI002]|uniref:hypothetical protein n=1 Tax=Streptomyces sp. IBSNAI002 TaxID=3457500 RepID=UPI003FD53A85
MTDHTDSKGRTPAARVMAVKRATPALATEQWEATQLLTALLDAAAAHGVTLDDFDWVADLPGACLDVTRRKTS